MTYYTPSSHFKLKIIAKILLKCAASSYEIEIAPLK